MQEKISIIIPVYNAEKYLEKCLDSVFEQTYNNIELICINDGSTDKSEKILTKYMRNHPENMVIKTIPNGGQANARNIGISVATGKYVCFVDSDDTMDRHMVEKMYGCICLESYDLVVCEIQRELKAKVSFLERFFRYDTELEFEGGTTIYKHPEIICFLTAAPFAKLIKKSFLDENNIKFVKNYIYEDLVFTQTLLTANPHLYLMKERLYKYLVRNDSTMTSKKSKVLDMFVSHTNFFNEYEKRGLVKEFKEELDFLCLYHVMIGTSYRMFRSGRYGLITAIKKCRKYCKQYKCTTKNSYIKKKGILAYLFVRVTLWGI